MNSLLQFPIIIMTIVFVVILLIDCLMGYEFDVGICRNRTIIIVPETSYKIFINAQREKEMHGLNNDLLKPPSIQNPDLKSDYKSKIDHKEDNSGNSIDNNEYIDETILKGLQLGIQETIKMFNKYTDIKEPTYFHRNSVLVDIPHPTVGITFKAFAPQTFLNLQSLYNITEEFNKSFETSTLIEAVNTGGLSGSNFYWTKDWKFFLKSVTEKEYQFLSSILLKYFSHFCEFPNSLLPNFSGLYYINYDFFEFYIVVMSNVYPYPLKNGINRKYDLKGNHREASVNNEEMGQMFRLLDNNFTTDYRGGLKISTNVYNYLVNILKNDCDFLKKSGIIDYSMILVTKTATKSDFKNTTELQTQINNSIKDKIYNNNIEVKHFIVISNDRVLTINIGIVDILQTYNFTRQVESIFKSGVLMLGDNATIQDPDKYANRFLKFLTGEVFKESNKYIITEEGVIQIV